MLEDCTSISSCESFLMDQVKTVGLLGQIPLTNSDFDSICSFISEQFEYPTKANFEESILQYPATLSCYLVQKGIFNYNEGSYWNSISDEIKNSNSSINTHLGSIFLNFIDKNNLFHADIPRSKKYITPILMHGIIPQEQVPEYFDKIIYPLVTKELVRPTDPVELSYWLDENRNQEREEEYLNGLTEELNLLKIQIPSPEAGDPDNIKKIIENLNQEITILSDQLNALKKPDNNVEILHSLDNDIKNTEKLEEESHVLKRKKEIVSDRIKTLQQTIQKNPVYTAWPDEIPSIDTVLSSAENELIDNLQYIAENGTREEQDKLSAFLLNMSLALENKKVILSEKALKKYYELVSFCTIHLSEDENDEFQDITCAHAYGTFDSTNQTICASCNTLDKDYYPEANGNLILLKMHSLYKIENLSSFYYFDAETEMGNYLMAHVNATSFQDGSSGIAIVQNSSPISDYGRILDSLSLYLQEETSAFYTFDPETEMGDYLISHTSASAYREGKSYQIFEADTLKQAFGSDLYSQLQSLYEIENEVTNEVFHLDEPEPLADKPQKISHLDEIAKSFRDQMIVPQNKQGEQKQSLFTPPSLTPESIRNVRDSFFKNTPDTIEQSISTVDEIFATEIPGTIDFGLQKNSIEWEPSPFGKYKNDESFYKNLTKKPEKSTQINIRIKPFDEEIFKTNQIPDSDNLKTISPAIQSETHEQSDQKVIASRSSQISLADENPETLKIKKKSFFIRIIKRFFGKSD